MGESGKPDIGYRFADHARYLDAWLDAVLPDGELVFVGHDWGGALAMDWAARHDNGRVRGLALIETFLRPLAWSEMVPVAAERFRAFRTPGVGEELVLEQNAFIEGNLPAATRNLAPDALDTYRALYPDPASRKPLLAWSREFPLDGEPADVTARMVAYGRWLRESEQVPKLLMTVTPAQGLGGPAVIDWARDNISSLSIQDVGEAGHHAPEDQPDAIGRAVARWLP
jgi:haloalkane dehalogenase